MPHMIPMPHHVLGVQSAYARLIAQVKCLIVPPVPAMTPEMALLIAHLGTQRVTASQIAASHYSVGTNLVYNLACLERMGLLTRQAHPGDARKRIITLTAMGLALAVTFREGLAEKPRAWHERSITNTSRNAR